MIILSRPGPAFTRLKSVAIIRIDWAGQIYWTCKVKRGYESIKEYIHLPN